jgi:hypothetical protein
MGFRSLDLCNNPIGDDGAAELSFALERTNTLQHLYLFSCQISDIGGRNLQVALMNNASIVVLDVRGNHMNAEQESLTAVSDI